MWIAEYLSFSLSDLDPVEVEMMQVGPAFSSRQCENNRVVFFPFFPAGFPRRLPAPARRPCLDDPAPHPTNFGCAPIPQHNPHGEIRTIVTVSLVRSSEKFFTPVFWLSLKVIP